MNKMFSYLQKRQQSKLYKQWVKRSGLSAEDIPDTMQNTESDAAKTGEDIDGEMYPGETYGGSQLPYKDSVLIRFRIKYIFIMEFFIAVLLVALSVVSTILFLRSC